MEEANSQLTQIALLSGPGKGHLIPLAALAEHLDRHHRKNFRITLITQPTELSVQSEAQILDTLPKNINIASLPPVPTDILSAGTDPHAGNILAVLHNLPHLRNLLKTLASATPLAALVVDIYCCLVFDIAREIGVPPYVFYTSSSFSLAVIFSLLALDQTIGEGEFRDMVEPVRVPGCVPVHGRDAPEPFQQRGTEAFESLRRFLELYYQTEGILVNSFEELELGAIEALKGNEKLPPIYPVGPLVRSGNESAACLEWLDQQKNGSVIYVSFGSGGTLTREQTEELALGLEMSGQRFLWVAKSPNDDDASGSYFGVENGGGDHQMQLDFLPEGFLERTKEVGMVVPMWAPQMEVLGHRATGGFVTHCGWNSTLESVAEGVPMIAWPLFAEQKINAVLLADDLKVALRVEVGESGVVGREEIARLVRRVMEEEEGLELRRKVMELRDAGLLAVEEGGSSFRCLSLVAARWKKG